MVQVMLIEVRVLYPEARVNGFEGKEHMENVIRGGNHNRY